MSVVRKPTRVETIARRKGDGEHINVSCIDSADFDVRVSWFAFNFQIPSRKSHFAVTFHFEHRHYNSELHN